MTLSTCVSGTEEKIIQALDEGMIIDEAAYESQVVVLHEWRHGQEHPYQSFSGDELKKSGRTIYKSIEEQGDSRV